MLESEVKTSIAVTGAEIPLTINNKPAELWQSHSINPGDRIELGFARSGVRAYLAIAGGFQVQPVFNSVATVTREGLGGLQGDGSPRNRATCCPASSRKALTKTASGNCPASAPGLQPEIYNPKGSARISGSSF